MIFVVPRGSGSRVWWLPKGIMSTLEIQKRCTLFLYLLMRLYFHENTRTNIHFTIRGYLYCVLLILCCFTNPAASICGSQPQLNQHASSFKHHKVWYYYTTQALVAGVGTIAESGTAVWLFTVSTTAAMARYGAFVLRIVMVRVAQLFLLYLDERWGTAP